MPAGSATARAATSRTDLWDASALSAVRQSAVNWSRSNMFMLPLWREFHDKSKFPAETLPHGGSRRKGQIPACQRKAQVAPDLVMTGHDGVRKRRDAATAPPTACSANL